MTEAILERVKEEVKFEADPLISFIVPIYDIKPEVLKRCLMSLEDQDYDNKEVVCVFDGPNEELLKVALPFVEKGFKVIEIEHAGACAARNAGFNASTGEIVSFFNSDYVAKPGMARMWVNALQEHPDCGFVYGSYQYNSANGAWYPSKPFDPYLLDVANFIDCGFPLWRKYVVKWDPDCKSLQDWDFWIRVVRGDANQDHNHDYLCLEEHASDCKLRKPVKGFYLPQNDFSFVAEPPRPKGLSDDSANNWVDRVTYVKTKNNIPLRDILVTSIGAPNHGIEIAKMIGADYRDDTRFKPWDYKAIYLIGFFMRPDIPVNDHPSIIAYFKEQYPNTKRIVHFVGADIYWLRKFPYESLKYLTGALNLSCDHILCETPEAQAELNEFGIKSEILPIPSYSDWEIKPLPQKFSVSVFLTEKSDFDKYCFEPTLSIVRAMPDVQFTAYGDGGRNVRYPNLEHSGNMSREDWQKYVSANSALLRLVRHDTLPMAGCEFLMAGRDVITNIEMPYGTLINTKGRSELNEWDKFQEGLNAYNWPKSKKQIVQQIRELKRKQGVWLSGRECQGDKREEIHGFYANLLDRDKYLARIKEMAHVQACVQDIL